MTAWGNAGAKTAWADEVDQHEEKNGKLDEAFPTLGEAAKSEKGKGKKVKGQKLSLAEFNNVVKGGQGAGFGARSDKDILLSLPKAPVGRVEGEERATLGGAFNKYGDREERGELRLPAFTRGGRFCCTPSLVQPYAMYILFLFIFVIGYDCREDVLLAETFVIQVSRPRAAACSAAIVAGLCMRLAALCIYIWHFAGFVSTMLWMVLLFEMPVSASAAAIIQTHGGSNNRMVTPSTPQMRVLTACAYLLAHRRYRRLPPS